ncbi:Teichoic acids export ATP-binding protein TagH [bioreactor metagenome]|uniref:Teichoic acids export ATP-binding protein TagH n=1 Tax=bioreactor metagenome TaxID=1076179 RepID=A0A644YNQ9_9ZZZZ
MMHNMSDYTSLDDAVIRLENVSVEYIVPTEQVNSLKEYFINILKRKNHRTTFSALNQINLTINRGEVWGFVGSNGAGKSTLMKVISRVLVPTSGRVWLRGHVYPLLQLGAGFHPELTGKENVFLNGVLLGHTVKEIEKKFDDIVDFADIKGFIDAPVRTYSTGMRARLGFSVATAWIPEILILDEVLSVGDFNFQKKCLERIALFKNSGATVLLVSHTIDTVKAMCNKAMWLDHGTIVKTGSVEEVTEAYQPTI